MEKTIFKYNLKLGGNTISMPLGAQILTAQVQQGQLCIWVIVDQSESKKEDRYVQVFGTGHPLPVKADVSDWIATVQDGSFVWHLFEFVG
jgi:hypothetical protein